MSRNKFLAILLAACTLVVLKSLLTDLQPCECDRALHDHKHDDTNQVKAISSFLNQNWIGSETKITDSGGVSDKASNSTSFIQIYFNRSVVKPSERASSTHPKFPGYIIENPELCTADGQRVDVLVYLHSATENRAQRRAIRNSWASKRAFHSINLKLVFVLGRPVDPHTQLIILSEQAAYGDIIQADFMDTFKNLSYKAVTFYSWANTHCAQARYVVKADDDMFVDMFSVLFIIVPKLVDKPYAMACDYRTKSTISRKPGSRWFVNETLLTGETDFPPYCPGYFTVLTGSLIPKLYEATFSIKDFLPVDDVYITGLTVKQMGKVDIVNLNGKIISSTRVNPEEEVLVNMKFQYMCFKVKTEDEHMRLWNHRLSKLSSLEKQFSSYWNVFGEQQKQSINIV